METLSIQSDSPRNTVLICCDSDPNTYKIYIPSYSGGLEVCQGCRNSTQPKTRCINGHSVSKYRCVPFYKKYYLIQAIKQVKNVIRPILVGAPAARIILTELTVRSSFRINNALVSCNTSCKWSIARVLTDV